MLDCHTDSKHVDVEFYGVFVELTDCLSVKNTLYVCVCVSACSLFHIVILVMSSELSLCDW